MTASPVAGGGVDVLAVLRREERAASLEIDKASARAPADLSGLTRKAADAFVARREREATKRRARWDEARAALAAVAELIAAVQAEQAIRTEYREWEALHPDEQVPRSFWQRMASANARTAAALSNIEGART